MGVKCLIKIQQNTVPMQNTPPPQKKKINFDRDILESRRYAYVYYVFKSLKSNKVCESKQKKPQNEVIKLIISPIF